MDDPRSAQLLNKINTDNELKAEMYNNVERYGLTPFLDNSKSTEEIHKILVSGIVKGDSASSIKNAITEGFKKHHWETPNFSSCPILDNPSTHSDPLAPIVATLARGSRYTKNCLTSQITKCFTTPHLLARIGVLPPNTQILLQPFAAYNIDRDEVYTARAVSSFISFLLKTHRDRLVYLSVNEILRLGLPPEHIVPLVLVFINIHPNIKLLSAGELCMPFLDVVSRNFVRSLSEKLINDIFGGPRHPGVGLVGIPISEQKYSLDAEIIINGTTTTIKTYALSLLHDWRGSGIESLPIPSQIKEGISRGSSHPIAKTIRIKVKYLVNKLTTTYFKNDYLTLDQQVANIDEVIDNEMIAAKLPISIGEKKYVVIYLRNSKIDQADTVFELAASQFTICYASGVARKFIKNDTELIIIFDNGKVRDNDLNTGLARAFAYIRDGVVIAFISSTSIRCTSIRVLFRCLQRLCVRCDTQLIIAEHSSILAAIHLEYENGRKVGFEIKQDSFKTTTAELQGNLQGLALELNKCMATVSSGWYIPKALSLFSDQLKHAMEQQRLEKEAKKRKEISTTKKRKEISTKGRDRCILMTTTAYRSIKTDTQAAADVTPPPLPPCQELVNYPQYHEGGKEDSTRHCVMCGSICFYATTNKKVQLSLQLWRQYCRGKKERRILWVRLNTIYTDYIIPSA